MTTHAEAPTVFISYSHKDESWKDKLLPQLRALELAGRIVVWDDRKIDSGETWFPKIKEVIERAAVSVCLISSDYLSSDFCLKEEVPYMLERRERDGMALIPVLLRPCAWQAFEWLKEIQMVPRDGKSVSIDFRDAEDVPFAEVANRVLDIVVNSTYVLPTPPPPRWSPPEKVDTARLPPTGAELFGRRTELEKLDEAWESDGTHVVSLVAWGGVGKSTLVNKWLERMEADNYRGARRVYAWSFYSQGTNERVTSADLFINNALEFFGDPEPTSGSFWDKGERLARLVRAEKTLLVLDGLEPLQSPYLHERGRVKDPALSTLLSELARDNKGLCLITTRERVTDLEEFSATVLQKDLEQISGEAGRALLRVGGVRGTDAEIEQATRDFGNHALAIQLLAVYLREIPDHHVSNAAEIPDLDIPEEEGRHPRRMLAAFERRFGPGPEVEFLRMLGLFDRPADPASLAALREPPAITGLTDHIAKLSEADWLLLIGKLRREKLIARASHHRTAEVDAHPLVRAHFGQALKQHYPAAWREGNSRLYEHLSRSTAEFPDKLEDMMPLYMAIAHGCEAGRHQEALADVFMRRVRRYNENFSIYNLGAYSDDLAALRGFFDSPWAQPTDHLRPQNKLYVLYAAGFALRALGYLRESTQPMKAVLEANLAQPRWRSAAITAGNLSDAYLITGDLEQALTYARQGVELADLYAEYTAEFGGQSEGEFQQLNKRCTLANALHQMGRLPESDAAFREAEAIQRKKNAKQQTLYSLGGFQYCALLLDRGEYREVLTRARHSLEKAARRGHHLNVALACLSMGSACLLRARREGRGGLDEAAEYLERAVDGLRHAGTLHELPRGLLAHAELHRLSGKLERARLFVDEAMSIASRGPMKLHQADCHLEYARLHLAEEPKNLSKARRHLAEARELINETGYHLRDKAASDLKEELEAAGG